VSLSWGQLVSDGIAVVNPVHSYWWLLLWPSAFLGLTLLSLNFLGDGLRDALDPKTR
jgi:ABC-type dipeptide/oligopeptide/nickel transport system permease subunit